MSANDLQQWIEQNSLLALGSIIALSLVAFAIARIIIARGLVYLAGRTETKVDDILVEHLRPFRIAWLAPLIVLLALARLAPDYQDWVEKVSLLAILWIVALAAVKLLNALNQIYERSPSFTGVSIQGYLDVVKILLLIIAIILSISLLTDQPPGGLLAGLGAVTAILLLIFRDTILSLVASVQISTNDLIREGDWLEVPGYGADGDVIDMNLHSVKIQNFDKTFSVIPTYKMVEVAYKNWRGMQESGGRRIKRSINIDLHSIKFSDQQMLERFGSIDLIKEYLAGISHSSPNGSPPTNSTIYRTYIDAYLRNREEIYQQEMTFLVRALDPGPTGLPIEIYAFTKTVDWLEYERIQADIFDHLLAAASWFDLKVFQYQGLVAST